MHRFTSLFFWPLARARTDIVIALCFACFMLTHGLNLVTAGYNIDDWGHVAAGSDWGVLGRWGLEVFYANVLGASFSLTLQIAIAFGALLAISFLLAYGFFEKWSVTKKNLACATIFLVGSSHPYWLDSHNFSTSIAAYPFTALISVFAFYLVLAADGQRKRWLVAAALSGAALFGAALSIYQPAALFGLIIPAATLIKVTAISFRRLVVMTGAFAVICVAGFLLYKLQADYYFVVHPEKTPNSLLQMASLDVVFLKLKTLFPLYFYSYEAGQFSVWTAIYQTAARVLMLWLAIVSMPIVMFKAVHLDYLSAARLVIGLIGVAVSPILAGWLVIVPDFPIRSLSLIAFPVIFLAFLMVHEFKKRRRGAFLGTLYIGLLVFSCGLMISSIGWSKQQRAYERDLAVAYAVSGSLISQQPVGDIFMAGNRSYPDLLPIASVGQSTFENYWATIFIFKELFDLDVTPVPSSPAQCEAVPAPGSIVRNDGQLYVCLQQF